ncbi:MAG: EF-hand domain-containing protein [Candidatus Hydrogenedentes bacterium]|nr:EF-hand domain-containing protein [Candidatus Hydrogenedentota bacterium]
MAIGAISGFSSQLGGVDMSQYAQKMAGRLLEYTDSDGDGALSIDEVGLSEDVFGEIDTDGDGVLSLEEIQADMASQAQPAGPPPPPRPESVDLSESAADMVARMIGDLDTDEDGALTIEESGFSEDLFEEIDADGNGLLDQEELETDLVSRMESHQGPPPGPPPAESEDDSDSSSSALTSTRSVQEAYLENSLLTSLFGEDSNSILAAFQNGILEALDLTA